MWLNAGYEYFMELCTLSDTHTNTTPDCSAVLEALGQSEI